MHEKVLFNSEIGKVFFCLVLMAASRRLQIKPSCWNRSALEVEFN